MTSTSDRRATAETPYQLTLAALRFPWRRHCLVDAATGLAFSLIAGPVLALAWASGLCALDWALQRTYARWSLTAAGMDSDRGLTRVNVLALVKALAWFGLPTAFTIVTGNVAGLAFVAILSVGLTALASSSARNSRRVFLTVTCVSVAALVACAVAILGLGPAAGVLAETPMALFVLFLVASGTSRTVAEWNQASQKTCAAMSDIREALDRSTIDGQRLRVAVEIANLSVYEIDYVKRTLTSTGAVWDLFDRPMTYETMWKDPFFGTAEEDLPMVRSAWARHEAGEAPYRVEYRVRRKDGQDMWAFATAEMTRDADGRPIRLVGALQDITGRKRIERELQAALERAEAASRAKSEFLATISHEIRTPLNGVLGMAQAMGADALSPSQRNRLEIVQSSGEALLVLLNSVLDLSKVEAGALELEDGEIDVAALCGGILEAFGAEAAEKGLETSLLVEPGAAGVYAGDPGRVRQMLANLVNNAVKFTDEGSVRIAVGRPGEDLTIAVTDTGVGIAPGQHESLFEPFVQADASITRRYGGSGLGLAICRRLATRMGGRVDLASDAGQGATFTVTLPLPRLRDAPSDAAPRAPETAPGEPKSGGPLRILAAEDNPVNQRVLASVLEHVGLHPVFVENGARALAAWRDEAWDLILMDIQMPVMDGMSATRAIRAEEAARGLPRTPIIALTANVMSHQMADYRAAGMDDVVGKPIELRRLLGAIEASLQPAACGAEAAA